jgi:hypothetical protein
VSSIRFIVVTVALVLAGATRRPFAASLASAPYPAPGTLARAATMEPAPASRHDLASTPSAQALASLRTAIGRRTVRVSVDQDVYELTQARFDSSGVIFKPGGEEGMPLWPGEDAKPIPSPITWDQIDCIRARRSFAAAGGIAGAALALAPVIVAIRHQDQYSVEASIGWAIVTPLVATFGAVVGGNVGAAGTWPIEWQRVRAARGRR